LRFPVRRVNEGDRHDAETKFHRRLRRRDRFHGIGPGIRSDRLRAGDGLKLYYEIHGTGEPLILLHGGLGVAKCSCDPTALASAGQVIAADLQATAHRDIDRPLSIEAMADDVAALIQYLKIEKTDLMVTRSAAESRCKLLSGIRVGEETGCRLGCIPADGWYPKSRRHGSDGAASRGTN